MESPTYPLKEIFGFRILDLCIKDMQDNSVLFHEYKDFSNDAVQSEIWLPANFFEINQVGVSVHYGATKTLKNLHMHLLWSYNGYKVAEQDIELGPIVWYVHYCWKKLINPIEELALMKSTFPDLKDPEQLNGNLRIFINIYEGDELITNCTVRIHIKSKD